MEGIEQRRSFYKVFGLNDTFISSIPCSVISNGRVGVVDNKRRRIDKVLLSGILSHGDVSQIVIQFASGESHTAL